MTPCYTNKWKQGKLKRYYYYRCTKTTKREWNSCGTKQVSANRLENFIFENLERISLDRYYLDSLFFMLKNGQPDDRIGLEPSQVCPGSPEIFAQTLQLFLKTLPQKRGIEKSLWAKKFIKNIIYSKENIQINLYYSIDSEDFDFSFLGGANKKEQRKILGEFSAEDKNSMVRNVQLGSPSWTTLEP